MRVLLDNATVTAAFRALGVVRGSAQELSDMDTAALGVIVDAVILADRVFVLDDYKAEHSSERKRLLAHPDVHFQTVPPKLSENALRHGRAHVANWRLSRNLSTSLAGIFDELTLLFRHAWRNSESFLVLKAFGVEDKYNSSVVEQLLDHVAGVITDKHLLAKTYNKETAKVVQAISWAAIRSVYYREMAKLTGTEYAPHPIRNTFNLKCILFDNHPDARTEKLHSKDVERFPELRPSPMRDIAAFYKKFWTACNAKDDNIFGVTTFDVTMPPFLAWFMTQVLSDYRGAGSSEEALRLLFQLRDDPMVTALRNEVSRVYGSDDITQLRSMIQQFGELRERMQVHLGYSRQRVPVSAKIVSYDMTVPRFLTKPLYPTKPHLAFIRDVTTELASIASYGRLLDAFRRRVANWQASHQATTA